MEAPKRSLRVLVDKWLAAPTIKPVGVTRFRWQYSERLRCVRVEGVSAHGAVAFFFFRHDNGDWSILPPGKRFPSLSIPDVQ
jgi:hypothetical protein